MIAGLEDDRDKLDALRIITEHVIPGRWQDARPPSAKELQATMVCSMDIVDASAKIRDGLPRDDEEDYQLPVWAGFIPLKPSASAPVPDPKLANDIPPPDYALNYSRGQ